VKILSEDTKSPIHKEILDKMAALITAAFGLVAALAWNDAIKAVFKEIFGTADAIGPMLILTLTVARAASRAKSLMRQEVYQCKLCKFTTKIESEFIEHTMKEHAASPDKFLSK
jgi:hypothetical protein